MKKTTTLLLLTALAATAVHAQDRDDRLERNQIRHVLLLSIDGMHAVDFLNCSQGLSAVNHGAPYCPHLASLGVTGVNYVAASTSKPSDSFPGLMSIVTGQRRGRWVFTTTLAMIARWMRRRR
jgi:predicted AlkP superfamily pyrophosphatase or phosphodiesterase